MGEGEITSILFFCSSYLGVPLQTRDARVDVLPFVLVFYIIYCAIGTFNIVVVKLKKRRKMVFH